MRDDYRIKDKYELSLDNRQIVTSFVAAIVVIGTVFVLGVVVGKKLASASAHASAPDLLTALDQRAAAMEQVKTSPPPEARLTFQEELTKKVADSPPKEVPPPPESPAEPAKVASSEKPPSSPAAQTLVEELPREKLKKAIASLERPPREVSNPPVAFTLQLSASQTREDADRFAAKLRAQGYQPYIVESDLKDRGRWYRVRMGKFPSKEAAAKFRDDFHRETKLDAFVTLAN